MSQIVPTLRAIVREETSTRREIDLGVITQVFTNEGGSGDSNLEVNIRLRGSALELQRVPVAMPRLGLSMAPRVDNLAVVCFVRGDLNGAVVLGFLYDEEVQPPDAKPDEVVYEVPDDEASGVRRLEIKLPNGNLLTVADEQLQLTMGGTTVTVESDGAVTVEAAADLNLKAQGAVNIEAGSTATIKGVSVTCEAQAEAKLKGASVGIAGITNFSPS